MCKNKQFFTTQFVMTHPRMPLTETSSKTIAHTLGGVHWQPYPGTWLIVIQRDDDSLITIDDDAIREYTTTSDLESSNPRFTIDLPASLKTH